MSTQPNKEHSDTREDTPTGPGHEPSSVRRVVNVEGFAAEIGLSGRTVRELVRKGQVQHRKFGTTTKFLLPDDLDAYLDAALVPRADDTRT